MESVLSPGVIFATIGMLTVMCVVPLYQCCASEPTKKQMKARIPVFLVLTLEIAYLATSYVSMYRIRKRRVKLLSHALIFCVLFVLSYVGFTVVEAPNHLKQAPRINKVWMLLTGAHICWLLFCMIVFFVTEHIFWEHVYLLGLSVYIALGTLFLLYVIHYVRRTVTASLKRVRQKSMQKMRTLPGSVHAGEEDIATEIQLTPLAEEVPLSHEDIDDDIIIRIATDTLFFDHNNTSTAAPATARTASPDKPRVTVARSLAKLELAKKKLTIIMAVMFLMLLWSLGALFWWSAMFDHASHSGQCMRAIPPTQTQTPFFQKCDAPLSPAPFLHVVPFLMHYVLFLLVYVGIMHKHSAMMLTANRRNWLWFRIFPVCLRSEIVTRKARVLTLDEEKNAKTAQTTMKTQPLKIHNSPEQTLDVQQVDGYELDALDEEQHSDLYRYLSVGVIQMRPTRSSVTTPDGTGCLELGKSQSDHEYTQFSKVQLSQTHLETNLDKIDDSGRIIGKRGAKRPRKMRKNNVSELALPMEYVADQPKMQKMNGAGANSITAMQQDLSEAPADIEKQKSGTKGSSSFSMIEDIIGQISDVDTVRVVVLELHDVLCTSNAAQLVNKGSVFVENLDAFRQKLFFGGPERLDMLSAWLEYAVNTAGAEFYIFCDEQSKMVVSLLHSVGLLKYFVSINPLRPNKLVSHVIGIEHKMRRECEGKRYLMLLKLLQLTNAAHTEMLYMGHSKECVEHIQSIRVCHCHHVQSSGLVQGDLDDVKQKF